MVEIKCTNSRGNMSVVVVVVVVLTHTTSKSGQAQLQLDLKCKNFVMLVLRLRLRFSCHTNSNNLWFCLSVCIFASCLQVFEAENLLWSRKNLPNEFFSIENSFSASGILIVFSVRFLQTSCPLLVSVMLFQACSSRCCCCCCCFTCIWI